MHDTENELVNDWSTFSLVDPIPSPIAGLILSPIQQTVSSNHVIPNNRVYLSRNGNDLVTQPAGSSIIYNNIGYFPNENCSSNSVLGNIVFILFIYHHFCGI
jgi:hypothetical protein